MKIKGNEVRLPKRFKEKWIKALRSGKYKQSKHYLYSKGEDGYCCLGVAGIVCGLDKECLRGYQLLEDGLGIEQIPKMICGSTVKSNEDYNPIVDKLTNMNDNKNKSFNYIASYIERYL